MGAAGTGADEHDLLGVADAVDPRFAVASLRAPLSIGAGYRWFEGMSVAPDAQAIDQSIGASSDMIMEWLRRVPEELGVDVRRVYLFGFSQGATISFTTLTSKWPVTGLIAGAVLVSGRLLPHMFSEECVSLRSRLAAPEQLEKLPVFISHGIDDAITPIAFARETHKLAQQNFPTLAMEYKEFPGGHSINGFQAIAAWLCARLG